MSDNETHDDGLNRRIAEWLGWRVRQVGSVDETGTPLTYFELVRPDGIVDDIVDDLGRVFAGYSTKAEAWQHAPDYEGDLNAVWAAIPHEDGWSLEVWTTPDGKPAAMIRRLTKVFYGRDASNHQQAAARALDAMRQQQEAGRE